MPLSKELAVEDLFPVDLSQQIAVHLGHLLEMRGIGLVIGEVGCGKTTSSQSARVVASLSPGYYHIFYVQLTTATSCTSQFHRPGDWPVTERNRRLRPR